MDFNKEYVERLNRNQEMIKDDFSVFIDRLKRYNIYHKLDKYNVIFYNNKTSKTFAKEIVFRLNGRCVHTASVKEKIIEIKELTNKDFFNWLFLLVLHMFNIDRV